VTAAIPTHGSLAVRLTGVAPPVTEAAAGNVTFTAATLAVQLATDGADMPGARSGPLADLACTLNPGQSATLGTVPVTTVSAAIGPRLPGQAGAAPGKPSATLWGSDPGGSFTAALWGTAALTDTATGARLICRSSDAAGIFKYGRNLPAAGIGSVTSFTLGTCHDQAGADLTVTTSASPSDRWPLNAESYQIVAAVATVGVTGITARIHGPGCRATVAGAMSTQPGAVQGSISTGSLGISPAGGTLRLWDVSGCSGLFADGNPLAVSASYSVSVPEVISPDYCPPPFSLTAGFPFPANYQPPPWPKKSLVIRSPPQPPSQGCAYIYGFSDVNKAHEAALTGPGLGNLQIGKLTVANPNYCLPHRPKQCSYLQVDESGRLYYKPCPGTAPRCRPVNGMPPVRATLLGFGFVPTTATVHITQLGNLDVSTVGVGSVVVEARVESVISMRISDVRVNGVPLNVGGGCHTPPFRLTLNGMKGYNITEGGGLAGTIDIPKFTGCGGQENLDPIFNAAISGPGNYVQLTQGAVCGDWPPGAATGCPPNVPKPLR
jgi:hypothetical protein